VRNDHTGAGGLATCVVSAQRYGGHDFTGVRDLTIHPPPADAWRHRVRVQQGGCGGGRAPTRFRGGRVAATRARSALRV